MKYPKEIVGEDYDDGTMQENVDDLATQVVGQRIVSVERRKVKYKRFERWDWKNTDMALVITLDNGKTVALVDESDCCAYTELEAFLLHTDRVNHIITGVGTTEKFERWHIYADYGDVLKLTVGWSCGNPFYYAYGFNIVVDPEVEVTS